VVPVFFVGVARLFPSQRRQQTEVDANSSAAVEPE
jgi:hypothetical protein